MQTPFFIKAIIVLALLAILASLALALVRLNQDRGQTSRTVKALTVRIGLSIALFLLIVVGFMTGLVVPHGVVP